MLQAVSPREVESALRRPLLVLWPEASGTGTRFDRFYVFDPIGNRLELLTPT
ncbi:MAG TPA: hypothetical protein VMS99_14830 [Acidimicrobiia bacterium]|nr:hypothetical protein [Acidimicrobiia bacterium]